MTGGGTGSIVWTRRSALPLFVDDQPAALYRPRAVGSRKDVDPPPEALARRRCAFGGRDVVITTSRAETSASGSGGRATPELREDRLQVAAGPRPRLVKLDVAVHDPQRDVVAAGEVLRDPVGDGHRSMLPAGAPDRDRQVGLALGDVGGENEVQKRK